MNTEISRKIAIAAFVGGFVAMSGGVTAAADTPATAIARAFGHEHPAKVSFAGDGELDALRAVARGTLEVQLVGDTLIVVD